MGLYKAAGAKYFMALAQHHDNFDCWDSKYQPWNSVAIGPKKDLVGTWAKHRPRSPDCASASAATAPVPGTGMRPPRARTQKARWQASRMTAI